MILRGIYWFLRGLLGRRDDPLAPQAIRLRVWPWDCDINLHLNNGRYLTMMDYGRFHLIARARLVGPILRHRWTPLVSGCDIRFLRPLGPMSSFTLTSRLAWWDEKYFYIEQNFTRGNVIYARALLRGLFRAPGRNAPTADVLHAAGVPTSRRRPDPDSETRRWVRVFQSAFASSRRPPGA